MIISLHGPFPIQSLSVPTSPCPVSTVVYLRTPFIVINCYFFGLVIVVLEGLGLVYLETDFMGLLLLALLLYVVQEILLIEAYFLHVQEVALILG